MTTIRKKTIIIETRQRTVIRYGSSSPRKIRCEFCAAEVETTTPEQSAAIFDIGLGEIYRSIENGELHFIKSKNNVLQICLNSLKSYERREVKNHGNKI